MIENLLLKLFQYTEIPIRWQAKGEKRQKRLAILTYEINFQNNGLRKKNKI